MRSTGSRRGATSRGYSRKPETLPTGHPHRLGDALRAAHAQNPFVLVREDFDEFRAHLFPVLNDPLAARTLGVFDVLRDQREQLRLIFIRDRLEVDGRGVAPLLGEVALLVEDVRNPAAHTGGEVAPAL